MPAGVPAELAGLATPLSNGIERALLDAGVGYGSTKKLTEKAITIKSARRHSRRACELAMERLASGASRWSR